MNSFLRLWARVFDGRVNRIQFFTGMILVGFLFGAVTLLFLLLVSPEILSHSPIELYGILSTSSFRWTLFPVYFLQGVLSVGLSVRRLKDCGLSPFFIFLSFLPYMNIPFFIFLLVRRGDKGVNMYGPMPHKRKLLAVVLNN